MSIPEDIINSVKERVNMVDLVSEVVSLKRSGKNFVGLCPFHSEKSGSFFVREAEKSFHCFGCGKKGSLFNFVMETRGFSFPEAVRFLANRVGVRVPEPNESENAEREKRRAHQALLREIVIATCKLYQAELAKSKTAQAYLDNRGLQKKSIQEYLVGYSPKSWNFLQEKIVEHLPASLAEDKNKLKNYLLELGLIKSRNHEREGERPADESAEYYDAFRGRIIFPILRSDGAPIAFGGRITEKDSQAPKYINSQESELYSKRKTLYGLSQAMPIMRSTRQVYLVEGYMDVISLHQTGVGAVVATCGTAATPDHALLLRRFVDRVCILYDGDTAGKKAAARCFEVFMNSGLDAQAVLLPDGQDPDSMARSMAKEELAKYFEANAKGLGEIFLEQLIETETAGDSLSPAAAGRVAKRFSEAVSNLKNPVEREFTLKFAAARLGVSLEALENILRNETRLIAGRKSYQAADQKKEVAEERLAEGAAIESGEGAAAGPVRLHPLLKQIVVAVLCEPILAKRLITFPELNEPMESEGYRKNVVQLLQHIVKEPISGISKESIYGVRDISEATSRFSHFSALLASYELENFGLLEEACRQVMIGGSEPRKVVSEAETAIKRQQLRAEMRRLKKEENAESDPQSMAELVQQKLLNRRNLERLGR